ncbi:protease inhibitor Inh/omp19 family protein [Breoghania sp.]|uniref:protease inhibitor Inh/omp19 family protein n=1 Tax=Breoghania sp. TaxID=2065378 RepID=UPI0026213A0A|nr:protease inhibitor Inh/omp19 family protein [Breoghania sp.]MDJ0931075.1 protease inhibitor Inh/omp19 family protein [Breoghania sp.]
MNKAASIAAVLCLGTLIAACTRFDYGGSRGPDISAPRQPVAQGGDLQPLVIAPNQDPAGRYGSGPYTPGGTLGPDGRPIGEDGRPYYDPNNPNAQPPANTDMAAGNPADGARSAPPPAAPEIGRTELLGGWTIASAGNSCKLFMTLTTWSGGYRANTQGCGGAPLGAIAVWDLNGAQILLKDANGTQIATLYKSAPERYDGRTSTGQPISVSR